MFSSAMTSPRNTRTVLLLFTGLFITLVNKSNCSPSPGLETSPLTAVSAVIGQTALLPCDVTSFASADAPILVLFFYGTKGTPIYSVDARNSSVYSGEHWSDSDQLGNRASLRVRSGEQGLQITRLVEEDAGLYRCRVDYQKSPSVNTRINLDIITPPRHILITSSWDGGRIVSGIIGPYPEGADITLSCQVTGGKPTPSVVWWQGGSLQDDSTEVATEQVTRNSLRLPRLTRADLLRKFTCLASNNNITAPLSTAVTIDLAFPPSSVRVWLQNDRFDPLQSDFSTHRYRSPDGAHPVVTVKENVEAHLACEAYGSRPQAFIMWRKNGRVVVNSDEVSTTQSTRPSIQSKIQSDGDVASLSLLKILPSLEDHKSVISCTTYNPKLPDEALMDDISLNVLYLPKLRITYESETNQTDLVVGDTFTLLCHVNSNPKAGTVQWAKNGVPILSGVSGDTVVRGPRLDVSRASRHMSGFYTCAAANSEGANTSKPLNLKIKFIPSCSSNEPNQYGAGIKEGIDIICSVDSYPPPLSFRWAVNNTIDIRDLPQSSYSSLDTVSTLRYVPHTEQDFGTVLCWASNEVGLMKEPCVINIVPAAKPNPVKHCRIVNNSSIPRNVALLSCVPGYDGGLKQTFALEVREHKNLHSRVLASVQSSPIPLFNMRYLKHGEEYLFIVTAVNDRGTSLPVTVSYTVPDLLLSSLASNSYDSSRTTWISWTVFIAVIFGCLIVALICFCGALFFLKFRSPRSRKNPAKVVYVGPIRDCEEKETNESFTAKRTIHCKSAACEEDRLLKLGYIQRVKDDCMSTLMKHRDDDMMHQNEQFRKSSGSDVRLTPTHGWSMDEPHNNCYDTYATGPYHNRSLSPPPPVPRYCTLPYRPPRDSRDNNNTSPRTSTDSLPQPYTGSSTTSSTPTERPNVSPTLSTLSTHKPNVSPTFSTLSTHKPNVSPTFSTLSTHKPNVSPTLSTLSTHKPNISPSFATHQRNVSPIPRSHVTDTLVSLVSDPTTCQTPLIRSSVESDV